MPFRAACDTDIGTQSPNPVDRQGQHVDPSDMPPGCCRKAGLVHAVALLIAAVGTGLLAMWIPMIDRFQGGYVLRALDDQRELAHVPSWLFAAAAAAAVMGGMVSLWVVIRDPRIHAAVQWALGWLVTHKVWAVLLAVAAAVGAVDGYELFYDPYDRVHGLRPWMLREDLQVWLGLAVSVFAGLAVWQLVPAMRWGGLRTSLTARYKRWIVVAAVVPCVMGAAMSKGALEGIPHFSDSLTYLMQGRILYSGHVSVDAPAHTDLFTHSLFFLEVDGRYFGKYPPGWPVVIGAFDHAGVLFMANAAMTALGAVLTGLLARQFAPRRVAVLAALLFGLSPWVWFHGASFASHVASTCGVLAFLWLFLRALRTNEALSAVFAGLALGFAVLVRPFDAAMFSLPAVFMVLYRQARDPKRWLLRGSLIAAAALVGVGVYMAVNANTTGAAMKSPYSLEARWDSDWNPSLASMAARACFQIAEVNGRWPGWGVGGITVALLGAAAAGTRWRQPGLRLLTISTLLFFFGSTVFVFTNVWWGPRWLLPVVPLLAILCAELIDRAVCTAARPVTRSGAVVGLLYASRLAMCILIGGILIGAVGSYAGRYYQLRLMPPHQVSGQAHRAVIDKMARDGIDSTIVALPPKGERPPLDTRAGIAFMGVPIPENPVIYVRAIDGWSYKAVESFGPRVLFEIIPDKHADNGFIINKLELE